MKGLVENMFFVIVVMLAVAISLIAIISAFNVLNVDLVSTGLVQQKYMTSAQSGLGVFNNSMIFIMVGFICAMVIAAVTINAHPVFAVAMIVIMIFVVIVAAILSNVFGTVSTDPVLAEAAATMPETSTMFTHLPLIALIGCIVVIIAMYGKGGGQP